MLNCPCYYSVTVHDLQAVFLIITLIIPGALNDHLIMKSILIIKSTIIDLMHCQLHLTERNANSPSTVSNHNLNLVHLKEVWLQVQSILLKVVYSQ